MSTTRLVTWAARALDPFPAARRLVKRAYKGANRLLLGRATRPVALHDSARLVPVPRWFGAQGPDSGLFFGYFDRSPWTPDMRRAVFHHATGGALLDIVMFEHGHEGPIHLGTSAAWNWQQGCMVGWMPPSRGPAIIYNTVVDRRLVAVVHHVTTGEAKEYQMPVQSVSPAGAYYLALNYRRLARVRPDYSYNVDVANFDCDTPDDADGIWRVDLASGSTDLLVSIAQVQADGARADMANARHEVNHILFAPDGRRFLFMHRWASARGVVERLFVADVDSGAVRLLVDGDVASHYCWRGANQVIAWASTREFGTGYHVINAASGAFAALGDGALDRFGDGHPSVSPDGRWLVTDTYPDRAARQRLLLFDLDGCSMVEVGSVCASTRFDGAQRCDLHPRWSPDGRSISIDSTHEGFRHSYIVDVARLLGDS